MKIYVDDDDAFEKMALTSTTKEEVKHGAIGAVLFSLLALVIGFFTTRKL